jgi:hypothetical protein
MLSFNNINNCVRFEISHLSLGEYQFIIHRLDFKLI